MAKPERELTWKDLEIGAIVTEPGNTRQYRTGVWRFMHPVHSRTGDWRSQWPNYRFYKCIKCGLCWIFCPEACIYQNDEGYFEADLYYCYGCGICDKECPTGVITMVEEE
ncbi:MAG: 4Fe-4S dicluster-binding protein [Dehalococcoidales bacterium]